jgi:serine protease AprX
MYPVAPLRVLSLKVGSSEMGFQRLSATKRFISLVLLFSLCLCTAGGARAQLLSGLTQTTQTLTQTLKVSPDLLQLVANTPATQRVPIVVQSNGLWGLTLNLLLHTLGARTTRTYHNFNARALDIPAGNILLLATSSLVSFVSADRPVLLLGHLSATTGADAVREESGTSTTLDGTGIGIAVIDSGIYAGHKAFLDKSNRVRVVRSVDFTGEGRTDDPFGHGSHVAGVAAGNERISNGAYTGLAPNANVVNLRVLDSRGTGSASSLLAALDWVLSNRTAYNIRVVNMSLGTSAVDSYRNDPICKAARRLVDAGVVVVAAAGNEGKDANGQKVYGRIHSPGVEPSVITVGATNTFGTNTRSDDGVATYSSRGPTRGYRTNAFGAKHYDNIVKPELVAPGNKLVSVESPNNLLVNQHPELDAGVSGAGSKRMMRLSGTSMATPAVAGAAALMLQANPTLTPNLVKALLMYTAQPLAGFNYFEQGMGGLNVDGAVRLARLVRTDISSSTTLGAPLLVSSPPEPRTTIAFHTFTWSRGMLFNYSYATGPNLVTRYQKVYGLGRLFGEGVIAGDGVITGDARVLSEGVLFGDEIMTSAGVIAGDGDAFCSAGVLFSDGGVNVGQVFGDGVITGDGVIAGDTLLHGDDTDCMEAPVDEE